MGVSSELDDKTLAVLVTLCDLSGQSHSIKHILSVFERSVEQVAAYREETAEPYKYNGF